MKWCPNPKCSQIVIVTRAVDDSITCACQHEFCFSCNDESHYPLDCDSLKEWNRVIGKNVDDPNQFLGANTKQCPKCKAGIEKN